MKHVTNIANTLHLCFIVYYGFAHILTATGAFKNAVLLSTEIQSQLYVWLGMIADVLSAWNISKFLHHSVEVPILAPG